MGDRRQVATEMEKGQEGQSHREEQKWPRAMLQKGVGWIEIQPVDLTMNISEKLPETV